MRRNAKFCIHEKCMPAKSRCMKSRLIVGNNNDGNRELYYFVKGFILFRVRK